MVTKDSYKKANWNYHNYVFGNENGRFKKYRISV